MKTRLLRCSLLALCTVSLPANFASAQTVPTTVPQVSPAPSATPGQRRGPRPNPVNLKVLAKDTTGDDLLKLMRQFQGDLGVNCGFCHARNPQTDRNDFASDANPVKDKARLMIKMTEQINAGYLAQLSDHKATDAVTCGTCHRGMSRPEAFVPKPQERDNRPPGAPLQPTTVQ